MIDEHFLRIVKRIREICIEYIDKKISLSHVASILSTNSALDNTYTKVIERFENEKLHFHSISFDDELIFNPKFIESIERAEKKYEEAIEDVKNLVQFIDESILEHMNNRK